MMFKFFHWFLILSFFSTSSTLDTENECKLWSKEHIFTTDEHLYNNLTTILIKFNQYTDLDKNCPNININATVMYFFPNRELLIDSDLDLHSFFNSFNFDKSFKPLVFQKTKGFNQNMRKISAKKSLQDYFISFFNLKFDFYVNKTILLTKKLCKYENFDKKLTNYFGYMSSISFEENIFYSKEVCPFVFMNTNLKYLQIKGISNNFLYFSTKFMYSYKLI